MTAPWYRFDEETLILDVRVQPGASRDEVAGTYGNRLKIRIAARPVDNAANLRLRGFLAKEFAVPPGRVRLVFGEGHRDKRVAITRPARLPAWLSSDPE